MSYIIWILIFKAVEAVSNHFFIHLIPVRLQPIGWTIHSFAAAIQHMGLDHCLNPRITAEGHLPSDWKKAPKCGKTEDA